MRSRPFLRPPLLALAAGLPLLPAPRADAFPSPVSIMEGWARRCDRPAERWGALISRLPAEGGPRVERMREGVGECQRLARELIESGEVSAADLPSISDRLARLEAVERDMAAKWPTPSSTGGGGPSGTTAAEAAAGPAASGSEDELPPPDPDESPGPPRPPAENAEANRDSNDRSVAAGLGRGLEAAPAAGAPPGTVSPDLLERGDRFAASGDAPAELVLPFSRYALAGGDNRAAERFAGRAHELDPTDPDALSLRSAARMRLGDLEGAVQDARGALRLDPSNKLGLSMRLLTDEMAADPRHRPPSLARLGGALQAGGGPGGVSGGRGLGRAGGGDGVAAGSGRGPGALGSERAGTGGYGSLSPSGQLALKAEGLVKLGDLKGALRQATLAIEADKKNPDAYAARAGVWNKLQRYLNAKSDADTALRLSPDHKKALNARAFALNMTGKPELARQDALRVLRQDPRDATAYLNLAMSQEALGDVEEALKNYERAAALDPSLRPLYEEAVAKHHPDAAAKLGKGGVGALKSKGAVGGLLALLASLMAGGTWWVRRAKARRGEEEEGEEVSTAPPAGLGPGQGAVTGALAPGASAPLPAQGAATSAFQAPTGPNGGRIVAGYELLRELGKGGMGVVYEALDNTLGRKVALKRMRPEIQQSARDKERFLTEARTVARLQHPNLVQIFAVLEQDDGLWLVFEHVDGPSLDKLLDQKRRLPPDQALPLLLGIAQGLDYAHSKKVIHRDLKPSNVMLADGSVPKVMDFGIAHQAKLTVSQVTQAEAFGTMAYMPPEQELGQTLRESDVYAFAVLAYELLLGRLPFPGPNFLAQKKALAFTPPSAADPGLPAALDPLFAKAFQPDPKSRHSTAGAFVHDFASVFQRA